MYYEYLEVKGPLTVKQLNEYGRDRWELVLVDINGTYLFKREREIGD